MRVLIASQVYGPAANGQSVFTAHLAEGLAAEGHQVTAVIPARSNHPTSYDLRGVQVVELRAIQIGTDLGDAFYTPFPGFALRRVFQQARPEIVHLQDHYPLSSAVFKVARGYKLPVIGTNHFLPENIVHYLYPFETGRALAERLLWWTMKRLYNQLDFITTPTETAASILRSQKVRPPVIAISCGVNLERYAAPDTSDRREVRRKYQLPVRQPLALYVGRIDEEKDLDVLLRAMALRRQPSHLAITGQGRHQAAIRALAAELDLDERVTFTGYVPTSELPGLLASADLFVMPSPAELQSIATLEAMASGLPVLAANARALPELVSAGVNGELFQPGDAADLAAKLDEFLASPERWASMGAASRELVAPHRIGQSVRTYADTYGRVLRAHHAHSRVLSAGSGAR